MADDPGGTLFQGLLDRGLSPVQAAALVGNMKQESGFDPASVNSREDAHGLLQWRQSRWQALQDYAKSRGTDPTDRDTQLDFIRQEMGGPEKRAGDRFLAAADLPSANAALKGYIRYGDQSQGTRLANASPYLTDQSSPTPATSPAVPPAPAFGPAGLAPAQPTPDDTQAAVSATQPQPQPQAPLSLAPTMATAQPAMPQTAPQRLSMPLTDAAKARLMAAIGRR